MIKHGPWVIVNSVRKYHGNRIMLVEDQVIRPNGESGTYATISLQPGVCVLPIDDDGFAYMAREFRYAVGRESIETVGGTINEGEDPAAAARRELSEELGIEARELISLGRVDPVTSIIKSATHLFLAKGLSFAAKAPDDVEKIERLRIPFRDVLRMADRNEITHAETCALLLRASRFMNL